MGKMFNFQPQQLIMLVIYLGLLVAFIKISNTFLRIAILIIAIVIFAVNPFRHVQLGVSSLESSADFTVSEKVVVKPWDFKQDQETGLEDIKKQSEDMKDEIHN